MRPSDAEIEKALRFHAAKIIKAHVCPCLTCQMEVMPSRYVVSVLAWVLDRQTQAGTTGSFAAHLTDLYDREDIAKLLHDPRMKDVLPG